MKPLTPEEKALLAELQEREALYRSEAQSCLENLWMLIAVNGEMQHERMVANAKQIRELLAPYDEAPVMLGEFVPAGEPRVVDVTGLHDAKPRYVTAHEAKLAPWCNHKNKTMVLRAEGGGAWRCDACLGITDDPNAAGFVEGESLAQALRFFGEFEEPLRSDGIRRFFARKKNLASSYWFMFPLGDSSPYYDSEEARENDIRGWRESL